MSVDLDTDFEFGFSQVGQNLTDPDISDRSSTPSSKSIFSGNRSLNFPWETAHIKIPSANDERTRIVYLNKMGNERRGGYEVEGSVKIDFGKGDTKISAGVRGTVHDKHGNGGRGEYIYDPDGESHIIISGKHANEWESFDNDAYDRNRDLFDRNFDRN